jgi:hypothetical protein
MVKSAKPTQAASKGRISIHRGAAPVEWGPRQPVDNAAKQHRFGKLRARQRQIGQHQRRRHAFGPAQLGENAGVEAEKGHGGRSRDWEAANVVIGEARSQGKGENHPIPFAFEGPPI